MTATVEPISVLLMLAALALGVGGVAVVVHELVCPCNDQRHQQRTHEAEQEISDISQRTQDAIVAELARRSAQQHRVVDGELITVRDEPEEPRSRS